MRKPKRQYAWLALTVVALLAAACGGSSSVSTTGSAEQAAGPTTTVTVETPTTTTTTTTTTTEAPVAFASLDERQRFIVDRICEAAAEPDRAHSLVGETTMLEVQTGFSGVPALAEAWEALGWPEITVVDGQSVGFDAYFEVTRPICEQIGWTLEQAAATTTTAIAASAMVTVEIGELTLVGETEGCPLAEILVGQYWVGPNRERWEDSNGEEWQVSLSVDATATDELKWSFSFVGNPTWWISYHENQPIMDADLTPEVGVFSTIFGDQIAAVSGGRPDTVGTVTIVCE